MLTTVDVQGHVGPDIRSLPLRIENVEMGIDPRATQPPCRPGRYAFTYGWFAVAGVPPVVAVVGGLVLPGLLVVAALVMGLKGRLIRRA